VTKHDQENVRQHNRYMILNLILKKRPISRTELTKITKMSPTSVGRIVGELCEQGLIKETELISAGVGRKAMMLDIVADAIYAIGVDIGKKELKFGVMDFSGQLRHLRQLDYPGFGSSASDTAARICAIIREIAETHGFDLSRVVGIGIGVPGVIDHERGIVQYSSTLDWRNVPLAQLIEERLQIPTTLDNDLKAKILAEHLYGSAQNATKTALIEIGSGIGSSLIIDGDVFRGGTNGAGELGHMTLIPNGNLCECGKRGCLQTYIDESSLLFEANRIKETPTLEQLFQAARDQEEWAKEILHRTSHYIGISINNLVCLYNPDRIILSGALVEGYSEMVPMIEAQCAEVVWGPFRETLKVTTAELKGQSIVTGAAHIALQRYMKKRTE